MQAPCQCAERVPAAVTKVGARRTIENALRRYGFVCVAGVDEVGRGCLAGPVMAGAVVLDPGPAHPRAGRLESADRSGPRPALRRDRAPSAWPGRCRRSTRDEIDAINIHQATLQAMHGRPGAGAPAGRGAGGCVPHSVAADGPARRRRRRSAVRGHRGRVDRRQGDARSADGPTARRPIRATGSTGTRDTPPPTISRPWRGSAIPTQHRRSFRPPTLFDTIATEGC